MKETVEKMRSMRLLGMARAFQRTLESGRNEKFTPDEFVEHIVEAEWDERHNRRLDRSVKRARFRYKASVEEIDFSASRVDRNQLLRLAGCEYIKRSENILITGSTGIGKSFIASALGHQACSLGYKVAYFHNTKLFAKMKMAKAEGTYLKELARIEKHQLLLIDDFGIAPLDTQSRSTLLEIIEDRHGKGSTIITSQLPVNAWHDVIGEQTIADAILDRLVHDAHRVEMKGESLRKKRRPVTEEEIDLKELKN